MALITPQTVAKTGTALTYGAVAASDTFVPDSGGTYVYHVKNGSGASVNVTLTDAGTSPAGNAAVNPVVAVPAGSDRFILVPASYVNPSTGLVTLAHSATASVTAALVRV